jgi:hypothetical protein
MLKANRYSYESVSFLKVIPLDQSIDHLVYIPISRSEQLVELNIPFPFCHFDNKIWILFIAGPEDQQGLTIFGYTLSTI